MYEIIIGFVDNGKYKTIGKFPSILAAIRTARRYDKRNKALTQRLEVYIRGNGVISIVDWYCPLSCGRLAYLTAGKRWLDWQQAYNERCNND